MRRSVSYAARDLKILQRLAVFPGLNRHRHRAPGAELRRSSRHRFGRPVAPVVLYGGVGWTVSSRRLRLACDTDAQRLDGHNRRCGPDVLARRVAARGVAEPRWRTCLDRGADCLRSNDPRGVELVGVAHRTQAAFSLPGAASRGPTRRVDCRCHAMLARSVRSSPHCSAACRCYWRCSWHRTRPAAAQQALALSVSHFMPTPFGIFAVSARYSPCARKRFVSQDRRLPVLLLRSFADDELAMPAHDIISSAM